MFTGAGHKDRSSSSHQVWVLSRQVVIGCEACNRVPGVSQSQKKVVGTQMNENEGCECRG